MLKKITFLSLFLFIFLFLSGVASAQEKCICEKKNGKELVTSAENEKQCKENEKKSPVFQSCSWSKSKENTETVKNPITKGVENRLENLNKFQETKTTSTQAASQAVGRVIKILLQVVGTVGLVMFIYGGLLIMTSEGQSDRYLQGLKTILWSSLGLVAIFASYALVSFVMQAF